MKVMMTVLMVVVLALTVGIAYAESGMTAAEMYNGITYFELGPTPDCASVYGAGAGGAIPEAQPVLLNGVTQFELGIHGSRPTGLCAGRVSEEKPWINNGITLFD